VVKEVNTKDDIWFLGWISGEVCEISDVGIHNARIKRLAIREIRKNGMTSFLVSSQRNQA
jgi:hypothetical protein